MKRLYTICTVFLILVGSTFAQKVMTPPHVMVIPDLIYCKSHGFTQQFNNNGLTETIPDYEKALSEDPSLHAVLTQVAQLITDCNSDIVIVDIVEAINNAKADAAMAAANAGDESESVDEAIIRNSEADILVKVQFDLVKNGPEYRVSYVLNGTDAYTSRNFAPVSGMGKGSTSANPVVLLREAVFENMAPFTKKLTDYYFAMVNKGRMIAFDIKTTSTSAVTMNSKVGEYTLREQIEDFLYDNSIDGNGLERVQSGNTFLRYQGVYVPLISTIRGRQRKQGAKDVAQKLVNFLDENGISAEYKIRGLGKVNIYIK
ncbi:MAG: hypothetical protein J6W52_04805 [Bacteroidaceae bacterium]|nr:hypothetical protein [Bacteroidaceae bacterium]